MIKKMVNDKSNTKNIDATLFYTSTLPMNTNNPSYSLSEGVGSNDVSQPTIGHTGTTPGNAEDPTNNSRVQRNVAMAKKLARAPPNPQDNTPTTSNRQDSVISEEVF